jgi:NADH-quinone oxidoreductase subunit A
MLTNEYFPLLIQLVFALGFVVLVLVITHLIGPARKSAKKLENFECGIEAKGNARLPFSIKYFLTAILFVLFDVEVIFFYGDFRSLIPARLPVPPEKAGV